MSDLARFAAKCNAFGAELERARVQGTRNAARQVAAKVRAETRKAAPGGVLSGVGKSGAVIGVATDAASSGAVIVKAVGPYQLIERDTAKHGIPRRRGKGKVLNIPGIGFRRYANHPGTKGKHPFEKGVERSLPEVPKVYQKEVQAAIGRTFG